jgi:beta-xylosidase
MIKTFTYDDVIRYVYEETSEEENLSIEDALMSDTELMTQFLDTLELRSLMDKIERQPRQSTIDTILHYSQSYPPNPASRMVY